MVNNDDAFGQALMDYLMGKQDHYIVERDDGFLEPGELKIYFQEFIDWPEMDKRMPELVKGRVLDVGCGVGRHSLHLQNLGFEVVAIDKSPLAVEVAEKRGVKNVHAISIDDLAAGNTNLGTFDSVIMMGHNIGLLHGFEEGKEILRGLVKITSEDARIIGTSNDPYKTSDPDHLFYHELNRERNRMAGQVRLRIRHRKLVGDWFDYLFVSKEELNQIMLFSGWEIESIENGPAGFGNSSYLAVLHKQKKSDFSWGEEDYLGHLGHF